MARMLLRRWMLWGGGVLMLGVASAGAAQHQIDFDDLSPGVAPAVFEPVPGQRIRIEGTSGSIPTVVAPSTGTRSPPYALRNEPAPGSEFGSADQDLVISFEGFRSHYVRVYVGMEERNAGLAVTATLSAYRVVDGRRVAVTSVSRSLGESPVSPNLPREMIVESATGEIELVRVSYGGFSPAELIDSLLIRVWDGGEPPPPTDPVPPVVHLRAPDPAGTPPTGSTVFVAGYVDEDRALVDLQVTTPVGTTAMSAWGDPPRYFFGGPVSIRAAAGPQTITVRATDLGGNTASDSVTITYTPATPPPPVWPDTLDFRALGLEVTQAIQDWEMLGTDVPGTDHITHVMADKRTLVRFYARVNGIAAPVADVSAQLRAFRGGLELPGSPMRVTDRVTLVPGENEIDQRPDPDQSFNFVLPTEWTGPGEIVLSAEVNPYNGIPEGDGLYNPYNLASLRVRFDEAGEPLHLLVYRVRSRSQGNVRPTQAECRENLRTLQQMYPLAPAQIDLRFINTVDTDTVLVMEEDTTRLSGFLDEFLDHLGFNSGRSVGWAVETVYLALTDDTVEHRGVTDGELPVSVSVANDSAFYRIKSAHESGHALGLGHVEGCDTPASPYEAYPRFYAPDGSAYPRASIGDWAVELNDDNTFVTKNPATFGDMMSYCGLRWVSKFTWERLYDIFAGSAPARAGRSGSLAGARPVQLQGVGTAPYLHLNGRIARDGSGGLKPGWVQVYRSGSFDHAGDGAYALELLDDANAVLFTRRFKPIPITDGEGAALFREIVPAPKSLARVVLRRGLVVLDTLKAGPAAPVVAVINPSAGDQWPATGAREIAWTASDRDQDPLVFQVEYSNDLGVNWRMVRSGLRRPDAALELDDLPGGVETCLIRVAATDGLHTTEAVSGRFSKASLPPRVHILNPVDAAVFDVGEGVRLEGSAVDPEDGALAPARLHWLSHRVGPLGIGPVLTTRRLSAGFHRIRLEAMDSDGAIARDEIGVFVAAVVDSDGDGLPDAVEAKGCTDPLNPDTDGDRIPDGREDANANAQVDPGETNPCEPDTDQDGMPDGWELARKLDPRNPKDALQDPDEDGFANGEEYRGGTEPYDAKSVPDPKRADLEVSLVQAPGFVVTQHGFAVTWEVRNAGLGPAGASWWDRVVLSRDTIPDPGDTELASVRRTANLAPLDAYNVTQDVNPPNVPAGDYYVIVLTDVSGSVPEVRDGNNTRAWPVEIRTPDLRPEDLRVPAFATTQHPFEVEWVVENIGLGEAAPSWWDHVYLSQDAVWDPADRELTSVRHTTPVAVGGNYGVPREVTLPNVAAGPYHVFLVADRSNSLHEADEDNNQRRVPLEVRVPDLVPVDLVAPSVLIPGNDAAFRWTVRNAGNGEAAASWWDHVYLSADNVWDSGDQELASLRHTANLPPNGEYTAERTVRLPPLEPGNYQVLLWTDRSSSLYEQEEANNVTGRAARVGPDGEPGTCIEFERLAPAAVYRVGDAFTESGVTMSVEPFEWSTGTWTPDGRATVDTAGRAGHTGQDLNLNNVNLRFEFGTAPSRASLLYGEYGGNLNLDVNGVHKNFNDMPDLAGAVLGGVTLTVTDLGGGKGRLALSGPLHALAIGGQELWIDHVCWDACGGPEPVLKIGWVQGRPVLSWSTASATLEQCDAILGPWRAVAGAASPFGVPATGVCRFFRLRAPDCSSALP